MSKTLEFYFDFGSPTTYLAWTQLPRLCAEEGATLVYKPMLLGGVFQATGNASPVTLLFTGATAGLRGAAHFAAFAGAKHALRALAQSMARELGPRNIHVAHVVVDGAIDTALIRDSFPDLYARKAQDGILDPEHIADNYWFLHTQPRDAWTFELDLRPWMERW